MAIAEFRMETTDVVDSRTVEVWAAGVWRRSHSRRLSIWEYEVETVSAAVQRVHLQGGAPSADRQPVRITGQAELTVRVKYGRHTDATKVVAPFRSTVDLLLPPGATPHWSAGVEARPGLATWLGSKKSRVVLICPVQVSIEILVTSGEAVAVPTVGPADEDVSVG